MKWVFNIDLIFSDYIGKKKEKLYLINWSETTFSEFAIVSKIVCCRNYTFKAEELQFGVLYVSSLVVLNF